MTTQVDIQIPAIEKELSRLLKQQERKRQRACLFTLIIYVHEERLVNYLQELVDTILAKFPCRIIFINSAQKNDSSYLHAHVFNVISGQNKGQEVPLVSCDQINIDVSKDQLFRIPYVVFPHIVTDLPVYLLWGQNPFKEQEIFPHLQRFASRIIVDSECSSHLSLFCKEMEANLVHVKKDVMDINWALTSNWRDLLTQLFDTPEKIADLSKITKINIIYNDDNSQIRLQPEIRSIYLQGWLASQLKWKYNHISLQDKNTHLHYDNDQTKIQVSLIPQSTQEIASGSILSMELITTKGRSYSLTRRPHLSQILIHISCEETCELPFTLPLSNVHRGLAFMSEIFFSKLGSSYHDMLCMISQIDYQLINRY